MPDATAFRADALFPSNLNAKPYRVKIYDESGGTWGHCETRTLIAEESRNRCCIEVDACDVKNSHGTDVDFDLHWSDDCTLMETAVILRTEYCPEAAAGKRYYKPAADQYEQKLRDAGAALEAAFLSGRELLAAAFPEWETEKLLYASSSATVFQVRSGASETCAIKLSPVRKREKGDSERVWDLLMSLGEDSHLIPVLEKKWLPLDEERELLAIRMPRLEPIGTKNGKKYDFWEKRSRKLGDFREDPQIALGRDVAQALRVLHENGLVHLDVKPENFFCLEDGDRVAWYLGDLGSVKPLQQQYSGRLSATQAYAAPEIMQKQPYSFSSDIYSWGRSMAFLSSRYSEIPQDGTTLTVRVSLDGIDYKGSASCIGVSVRSPFGQPLPESCVPQQFMLHQFFTIVGKALDPVPSARFQDGAELCAALADLERDAAVLGEKLLREEKEKRAAWAAAQQKREAEKAAQEKAKKQVSAAEWAAEREAQKVEGMEVYAARENELLMEAAAARQKQEAEKHAEPTPAQYVLVILESCFCLFIGIMSLIHGSALGFVIFFGLGLFMLISLLSRQTDRNNRQEGSSAGEKGKKP